MKTQKQMWKDINEPIVEKTGFIFHQDGTPWLMWQTVDRVPPIRRERRKQK